MNLDIYAAFSSKTAGISVPITKSKMKLIIFLISSSETMMSFTFFGLINLSEKPYNDAPSLDSLMIRGYGIEARATLFCS